MAKPGTKKKAADAKKTEVLMQKTKIISAFTLALFLMAAWLIFFTACGPAAPPQWYKGNLHTHTTNSDGDTDPDGVIAWYVDHGYNFLSITQPVFTDK